MASSSTNEIASTDFEYSNFHKNVIFDSDMATEKLKQTANELGIEMENLSDSSDDSSSSDSSGSDSNETSDNTFDDIDEIADKIEKCIASHTAESNIDERNDSFFDKLGEDIENCLSEPETSTRRRSLLEDDLEISSSSEGSFEDEEEIDKIFQQNLPSIKLNLSAESTKSLEETKPSIEICMNDPASVVQHEINLSLDSSGMSDKIEKLLSEPAIPLDECDKKIEISCNISTTSLPAKDFDISSFKESDNDETIDKFLTQTLPSMNSELFGVLNSSVLSDISKETPQKPTKSNVDLNIVSSSASVNDTFFTQILPTIKYDPRSPRYIRQPSPKAKNANTTPDLDDYEFKVLIDNYERILPFLFGPARNIHQKFEKMEKALMEPPRKLQRVSSFENLHFSDDEIEPKKIEKLGPSNKENRVPVASDNKDFKSSSSRSRCGEYKSDPSRSRKDSKREPERSTKYTRDSSKSRNGPKREPSRNSNEFKRDTSRNNNKDSSKHSKDKKLSSDRYPKCSTKRSYNNAFN